MRKMRALATLGVAVIAIVWLSHRVAAQTSRSQPRFVTEDPACQTATLVSTGGAAPRDPGTLAVRWTGFSNFELSYKGQIVLLDAYFDRGAVFPSLGFRAAEVKRADAILIGHAHFDHMSDAASIAVRIGAPVVGTPLTIGKLAAQSVPAAQTRTVSGKGGEVLRFGAFTVEPILGRHGVPALDVLQLFQTALDASNPKRTDEETAEQSAIRARGASSDRLVTDETLTYLITLDSGFRIIYRDSGGTVTDWERAAMARIGSVDLALVALPQYIHGLVTDQVLEYVHTYRPTVFIPAHHDAPRDGLWRPTEPIFQALKDENPRLVTVSKSYREPVCFDVTVAQPRNKKN